MEEPFQDINSLRKRNGDSYVTWRGGCFQGIEIVMAEASCLGTELYPSQQQQQQQRKAPVPAIPAARIGKPTGSAEPTNSPGSTVATSNSN
ncbi:hypothetical protein H6P81_016625 [Aristolochia fimbriata]|uniref:Uncharacterized protein n=1 Tax=Aristolochia fimbriata TaxID=158543 RepID=A0AAV7EAY6_ARIFI|nr:hypothetical protein H6P81_016625 [Aristolochia fimbriata]